MTSGLLLIAASGLAREVISVFGTLGQRVLGVLDDDPAKVGSTVGPIEVLGPLELVREHPRAHLLLCAGKGTTRRALADRLATLGVTDDRYATVIDSSVRVPTSCEIGCGSILLAGTVLTGDVTVGHHVVCMPHVTLTHDVTLDDFATLTAGVTLGGGVRIGSAAYLGMNSCVREGLTVGREAVLGMGSALIIDQPAETVYAGVPAHLLERE